MNATLREILSSPELYIPPRPRQPLPPHPVTAPSRLEMGIPVPDTLNHHVMALPSKSALGIAIAVSPMGVIIAYHPPLLRARFSGGSGIKSAVIPQKISHGTYGG